MIKKHVLKVSKKGLVEAAELEKGCDISAGPELTDTKQLSGVEFEPDKFIVINNKRIEELNDLLPGKGVTGLIPPDVIYDFQEALNNFIKSYEANIGPMDQKYLVCNQDEPYAEEVKRVILEGERAKLKTDEQKEKERQERKDDEFFDNNYA